ncbi:MAG: dockerin type I repeat-containing protein, partial [Candidatus Marinimicrobia bacterium]|nr:dockerin type I repeat-containing protein [Candidatus Neomarinimicrobiota bacterium]
LWNLNSNDEWYDDTESYAGERSVCHRRYPSSGDNIITNFEKRIKCYSASTKYSLQGYIKTQSASNVTIEIRYYESRTDSYYLDSENIGIEIDGDTDWTFYHKELTLPSQTKYFDIRLNSNCPDSDEALSWFDNVSITGWTNWQSINSTEEIEHPNDFYYLQLRTNSEIDDVIVNYSESGYNNTPQIFYGDVNNDGAINVLDIVLVVNIIMEQHTPSDYEFWAADANEDGNINVMDIVLIVGMILEN